MAQDKMNKPIFHSVEIQTVVPKDNTECQPNLPCCTNEFSPPCSKPNQYFSPAKIVLTLEVALLSWEHTHF
jgi:hypothetical protein